MSRNIIILQDRYSVSIDDFQSVQVKGNDGGSLETQSVEALLLVEIIRLLQSPERKGR